MAQDTLRLGELIDSRFPLSYLLFFMLKLIIYSNDFKKNNKNEVSINYLLIFILITFSIVWTTNLDLSIFCSPGVRSDHRIVA